MYSYNVNQSGINRNERREALTTGAVQPVERHQMEWRMERRVHSKSSIISHLEIIYQFITISHPN